MEPVEFAKRKRCHVDIAAHPKDRTGLHEIRPFGKSQTGRDSENAYVVPAMTG